MILHRLLPLVLAVTAVGAQEAPPWGVGILGGAKSGKDRGVYGSHMGVEGSWQFLREHWVQGRLRAEYLHLGPASTRVPADPSQQAPAKGDFFVFSCDWIFRTDRPYGVYFLLGTGMNVHTLHGEQVRDSGNATGNAPSFAWGFGWLFPQGVELEMRQDWLLMGALGGYADGLTSTVVLRKRF